MAVLCFVLFRGLDAPVQIRILWLSAVSPFVPEWCHIVRPSRLTRTTRRRKGASYNDGPPRHTTPRPAMQINAMMPSQNKSATRLLLLIVPCHMSGRKMCRNVAAAYNHGQAILRSSSIGCHTSIRNILYWCAIKKMIDCWLDCFWCFIRS